MTSEASRRAREFVTRKLAEARGLGQALGDLIDDPEAFVAVLRDGFSSLADDAYAAEQRRIVPGTGRAIGVRWPLIQAVARQLRQPLAESAAASALSLAQRLAVEDEQEMRLFSHVALRRSLPDDPERTWQLMRQLARAAGDWVAVDSLADLYARGILDDRRRWAELEQLVYSRSPWERRLVGSTVATIPHRLPRQQRELLAATPALTIIKSLIGDDVSDVQKALSWALRSWNEVDRPAVEALLRDEAARAVAHDDGHRAWVVRDALTWPGYERAFVDGVRARLEGVRRRPGAPATSTAAQIATAFAGLERLSDPTIAAQGERMRMSR